MSDQHLPKRTLLPSKSLQTTAERYAEEHGIPSQTSAALSTSVAMRVRQNIAMGYATNRTLQPTQSLPVALEAGINLGFMTASEIQAHAAGVLNLSTMRSREVQPFSSLSPTPTLTPGLTDASAAGSSNAAVDALSLSPRGKRRVLRFSADGEVEEIGEGDGSAAASGVGTSRGVQFDFTAAKKRQIEGEGDEEDEGEATETDDDPVEKGAGRESLGFKPITDHGFPAVFTSPQLSHPSLFSDRNRQMLPPAPKRGGFGGLGGRPTRGLPGRRALGKAVSAPVGSLWGGAMDVDDGEEDDGYDPEDWAKSQNEGVKDWASRDDF